MNKSTELLASSAIDGSRIGFRIIGSNLEATPEWVTYKLVLDEGYQGHPDNNSAFNVTVDKESLLILADQLNDLALGHRESVDFEPVDPVFRLQVLPGTESGYQHENAYYTVLRVDLSHYSKGPANGEGPAVCFLWSKPSLEEFARKLGAWLQEEA